MKLSVVVPSHNDCSGLYFTFAATHVDLEQDFAAKDWEFIAVLDNDGENDVARGFEQQKTCRVLRGSFNGPQNARNAGAAVAEGEYVVFLDSHVVPARGMFRSLIRTAEETGAAIVHAPHSFWNPEVRCYGYEMDFNSRFWCIQMHPKPKDGKPFRVAVMGHGAMLVNAEKFRAIDGYGKLMHGWGGEEPYLNLKVWHTGGECWVDPSTYHFHYMTKRRNSEVFEQRAFVRNFMLAAYVNGGQKYLDAIFQMNTIQANGHKTVEEAFEASKDQPRNPYVDDYNAIPITASGERCMAMAGPFGGDLDRLRDYFKEQNVLH